MQSMTNEEIQALIKTPLTDQDLNRFGITPDHIIKYSDFENVTDIEEILPEDKSFKIILIEYKYNTGHWVTIMRYGNTLEYFNSFGLIPSKDDFTDNDVLNEELDQEHLFLNNLLGKEMNEDDFANIIYNKVKFQSSKEDINTCGRHCILRILCMLYYDMDLAEYIKFMKDSKKKSELTYDELVSVIIS